MPLSFPDQRAELCACLREMSQRELSAGTTGNASLRVEGGMLISATGLQGSAATPADLVFVDMTGQFAADQPLPSSEWHMHLAIYQRYPDSHAIVHCHSRFATALACQHRDIPAFHYMVAIAGGDSIPCAAYATFGTEALADTVVDALSERKACLMANHGQIVREKDLVRALQLSIQVEELAAMYSQSLLIGEPVLLDGDEMQRIMKKFEHYGQNRTPQ